MSVRKRRFLSAVVAAAAAIAVAGPAFAQTPTALQTGTLYFPDISTVYAYGSINVLVSIQGAATETEGAGMLVGSWVPGGALNVDSPVAPGTGLFVCNEVNQDIYVPTNPAQAFTVYANTDAPIAPPTNDGRVSTNDAALGALVNQFLNLTNDSVYTPPSTWTTGTAEKPVWSIDSNGNVVQDSSFTSTQNTLWSAATQLAVWQLTYGSNLQVEGTGAVYDDAVAIENWAQGHSSVASYLSSPTNQDQLTPNIDKTTNQITPVPEPAFYQMGTLLLLGALGAVKRRRSLGTASA